ncbi:sulfite exporter TauE/SafE family protein [Mucilaginibacter robiniae]|uniref:Sulfite exporter TauE/SafE family protein n=1 Tax=Mucilaginibacter robiniae TaxID=2728022 RepID=A0A7L5E740_9SPHI|nr:sulfite exporter TauE/SafE family protein [Mucilaginibacter robiniae]QJD98207.1 sulfite exporter TauE/SafE family protein [Mucilaginibacter robiniae]
MSNNEIAFFVGLFGSVHCVGMCGPLAFAVSVREGRGWLLVWDKLVYNLGRTFTYTLLGIITGLIGRQLWLAGMQQWVSLLSGVLIVLAAGARFFKKSAVTSWGSKILLPFNRLLTYALTKRAGHWIIGMLNGFLPCGFVYLALIGAVNTGSVNGAAQYMFWFGIGTLPLMLIATVGSGLMNMTMRRRINKFIPYVMLCLGIWFLLRGMNLDIPYLSPSKNIMNAGVCR